MSVLDLINERAAQLGKPRQGMQAGVIIGVQRGHYRVSAGGTTYTAESGIAGRLKAGDRVWIVLGRGTTRILGLMGPDADTTG